eukprot:12943136-Alexandrium_andersonii.AAC.1
MGRRGPAAARAHRSARTPQWQRRARRRNPKRATGCEATAPTKVSWGVCGTPREVHTAPDATFSHGFQVT